MSKRRKNKNSRKACQISWAQKGNGDSEQGIVLAEILLSSLLLAILLTGLARIIASSVLLYDGMLQSLDSMQNGRYSRVIIANRIRFAQTEPVVGSDGQHIRIEPGALGPAWHIRYIRGQLYRQMSDGDLQPFTGTALSRGSSQFRVVPPADEQLFQSKEKLTSLRWGLTGTDRKPFYTVHTGVYPDYCYYIKGPEKGLPI